MLFLQAAVEELPGELNGIASEVTVQFPWGSLLRAVAGADEGVLSNLRRVCLPGAQLSLILALDPERDHFEWKRLGLAEISLDCLETVLAAKYRSAGFSILQAEELSATDLSRLHSSWARRLQRSSSRSFIRIVAEAEARYSLPTGH